MLPPFWFKEIRNKKRRKPIAGCALRFGDLNHRLNFEFYNFTLSPPSSCSATPLSQKGRRGGV